MKSIINIKISIKEFLKKKGMFVYYQRQILYDQWIPNRDSKHKNNAFLLPKLPRFIRA